MLSKKLNALLFILLILFCLSAVNAESINDTSAIESVSIVNVESETYVATIADDISDGSFTDLNRTINNNSNSEIKLEKNYTYNASTDTAFSQGIIINRTLTIDGNGHTINANHTARIFYLTSGSLTLKNINLINGYTQWYSEYGGAIYAEGNLTIINSTLTNNTVGGYGGAIYAESNVTIVNSTFNNNNASYDGGAIYIDGNNSIYVINSEFNSNYARYDGGAISSEYYTTINNSKFENNVATDGHAGAISNNNDIMGPADFLTIINSNFTNNRGLTQGGAINSYNGNIMNCNFINNSATDGGAFIILFVNVENSTFIDNNAKNIGGAIASYMCNIIESTFINNEGLNGGAIANYFGNGTIKNSKFVNNTGDTGGAIYNINPTYDEGYEGYHVNGSLNIENCEFSQNKGLGDDIYTSWNTSVANNTYTEDSKANIYANNTIVGGTVVTVLGNGTYYVTPEGKFRINATVYLDGATYEGYTLTITDGEKIYSTVYKGNGIYEVEQELTADFSEKIFSAIINNDKSNPNYFVRTSIITTIKTITIVVDLDDVVLGENLTGNITLKENDGSIANFTGQVTITVDGKNYTVDIVNGTGKFNIENNLSPGNYSMDVIFNGTTDYYPADTSVNFTVSDGNIILEVEDLTKYYGNSSKLIIVLTDSHGNPLVNQTISIKINGVTYTRTTNEEGKILMSINLIPGIYDAEVTYEDIAKNANVTILSTIIADDLIKYFKNGTQYYAKFLNVDGTPLANTNVTFNIHGVVYTRTTDADGIAKLNINLNPGEYIITAWNPVNTESKSNIITVLSTIFGENVVKYYRNGTQYYARVFDANGNPLANANVTFNIHGVFYNRTTNEEGIVKLNINLNPGKYIITAWNLWNGEAKSNNITVYTVVQSQDLEMTTSARKPFKVTILGEQGKPLPNAEVTFNIHGVFYNRTTDANGEVNLNINLVAGKYIITTYYNEYAVSNTIVVK